MSSAWAQRYGRPALLIPSVEGALPASKRTHCSLWLDVPSKVWDCFGQGAALRPGHCADSICFWRQACYAMTRPVAGT